jgi:hypothetical protein
MLAQATTSEATMPATTIAIIVIAAVAIILLIAIAVMRSQRSRRIRSQFGPEYDRVVRTKGSPQRAEDELARREKRVKQFELSPLPAGARARYVEEWRAVQTRFVDDPRAAVGEADRLILNVMRDRGYPMENFGQRAEDISVNYAGDVSHYRAGHALALKNERGEASTEELRQAFVHYRALFDSLLDIKAPANQSRLSA